MLDHIHYICIYILYSTTIGLQAVGWQTFAKTPRPPGWRGETTCLAFCWAVRWASVTSCHIMSHLFFLLRRQWAFPSCRTLFCSPYQQERKGLSVSWFLHKNFTEPLTRHYKLFLDGWVSAAASLRHSAIRSSEWGFECFWIHFGFTLGAAWR